MTKVYCTAPWNGLTVREDGHVKTCCNAGISLGDLNQTSLTEILKGNTLSNIQQSMMLGKPDLDNCRVCVDQEKKSGLSALRQHYLKFYPTIESNKLTLKTLDIRWNNTCNLSCMYCNPSFSSTWSDKLKTKNLKPVRSYQDELLDFVLSQAKLVQEIILVGGEPMLMKQNYQLLKLLPHSTKISIITNLSYDLENLPCIDNLLRRPRENVQWNVSCENLSDQFEYVRNGAKWNQFVKNIQFLQQHWPNNISILMVYSLFSAFELASVVQWFHQFDIKKFNLQSYHGDHNMDIFKMPSVIQQKALDILKDTVHWHNNNIHVEDRDFYPFVNDDLLKIKLQENTVSTTVTKSSFYQRLDWYNQWHYKKFQDLWPHVIDLVEKHLA